MRVSNRLKYIIDITPQDAHVIDVAADHGYTAIELAKTNPKRIVIASDVAIGPLNAGKNNATKQHIDNIDFRLGDGLNVILDSDKIDVAIIAGIGGKLMTTILTEGKEKKIPFFILQANNDLQEVRKWLYENHYHLIEDERIEDSGFIYECMVAQYIPDKFDKLYSQDIEKQSLEFYFGPETITRNKEITIQWLERKIKHYQEKMLQMQNSSKSETLQQLEHYDKLNSYAEKQLLKYMK